jgi:hypothetical protein
MGPLITMLVCEKSAGGGSRGKIVRKSGLFRHGLIFVEEELMDFCVSLSASLE